MKETEYAYIAGMLEADGSFSLNKRVSGKFQINPRINLVGDYRQVMDLIASEYHVRIYHDKLGDGTTSCYWRMYMSKRNVLISFVPKIYSFLRFKKEQAKLLYLFCLSRERSIKTHRNCAYTNFEVTCCYNVLYLNLPKAKMARLRKRKTV